jgi:PKD repeat protein
VNGVNPNIVTVLQFPPVTWTNPYGYFYIICNYSCDSASYQGGCNTPDQISHYYLTQFGGSLYYHFTQYGCWVGTYNVSSGGNCCIGADIIPPQFSLFADFSASEDSICPEQGIFFTNNSFNSYPGSPEYNWDFGDGSPDLTSVDAAHGYTIPGNYIVTLTITDSSGVATDTQTMEITVLDCGPTGIDKENFNNRFFIQPNPASEVLTFRFTGESIFPVSLEIMDATGRMRMAKEVKSASLPDGKVTWDIHELPAGLYLIRITGNNYLEEKKVMIE